jgi:hypothetical protein
VPTPEELRAWAQANHDLAMVRCDDAKAKRREAEQRFPDADEWREAYECSQRALGAMTRAYELATGIVKE